MTAQVIAIKPQTINALVTQTKAAWDRAEQKKADADDWALRTGKLLVELKVRVKEDGGKWLVVLKQLGRSERRAQELMQLAGGEATPEGQRDRKRRSVQRVRDRKKPALRSAGLRGLAATRNREDTPAEEYTPPTMEERWQYSFANLCGDILALQPYWDKEMPEWKTYVLPSHFNTLAREAATAFASLIATAAKR